MTARDLDLTPQTVGELDWPPALDAIRSAFTRTSAPIYLVGGAIRDRLLHRPIHDLDFVTPEDGQKLARIIANAFNGDYFPLDNERGIGRAIIDYGGERYEVDISRYRGADLAEDLLGRDFTVNAMAVDLRGDPTQIIDPLGGLIDLKARRLKRCSQTSISDDPIRLLRAIRQATAFKFQIAPETRADMRANVGRLPDCSVERVRDEFMKTLDGPAPHAALRVMDALKVLPLIVPETVAMHNVTQRPPHVYDVWEHTLKVIEALDNVLAVISPTRTDETAADGFLGMIVYRLDRYRKPLQAHITQSWPNGRTHRSLLMLAALLHDCGKPATRSIDDQGVIHFYQHEQVGADMTLIRATELRLSNDEAERVTEIVRQHMRPMHLAQANSEISRRSLYRYWNGTGEAGVDVAILTQADYLGVYGHTIQLKGWLWHLEIVAQLLEGYYFQREVVVSPPPLVNGNDLMRELGLTPGPRIGELLRAIAEAQAVGEITSVEGALELARGTTTQSPD